MNVSALKINLKFDFLYMMLIPFYLIVILVITAKINDMEIMFGFEVLINEYFCTVEHTHTLVVSIIKILEKYIPTYNTTYIDNIVHGHPLCT